MARGPGWQHQVLAPPRLLFLYIAVGFVILITPIRNGGAPAYVAVAGVAFILGWILLGVSWLIKLVPKYKPVAPWLLRPVGPLDVIALVVIAASLPALLFH